MARLRFGVLHLIFWANQGKILLDAFEFSAMAATSNLKNLKKSVDFAEPVGTDDEVRGRYVRAEMLIRLFVNLVPS